MNSMPGILGLHALAAFGLGHAVQLRIGVAVVVHGASYGGSGSPSWGEATRTRRPAPSSSRLGGVVLGVQLPARLERCLLHLGVEVQLLAVGDAGPQVQHFPR